MSSPPPSSTLSLASSVRSDDGLPKTPGTALASESKTFDPSYIEKHSGYLTKWTNFVKGWRKRYFVLESPECLVYFKNRKENKARLKKGKSAHSDYRNTIELHSAVIRRTRTHKRRFQIYTPTETYHLRAKSATDCVKWVTVLNDAKLYCVENGITPENENYYSTPQSGAVARLGSVRPSRGSVSASSMRTLVALRDALTDSDNLSDKMKSRIELLTTMVAQGHDLTALKPVIAELGAHSTGMSTHIQRAIDIANEEFERRMRLEAKLTLLEDQTAAAAMSPPPAGGAGASSPPSEDSGSDADNDDDYESDSSLDFYDADEYIDAAVGQELQISRSSVYVDAAPSPATATRELSNSNLDDASFPSSVVPSRDNKTLSDYVEYDGYGALQWRDRLPCDKPSKKENNGPSLWDMLKNAIGKDLSRITLPAIYMMPLTVLQRWAEELEYRYLVHKAIEQEDPMERLLYVTAFAMSAYGSTIDEQQKPVQGKPFNPLLGETFEWDRQQDWGLRFFAEQVSHHPPITAFHCVHKEWIWHGDCNLKNKFWGNSVEVFPTGTIHLHLRKWNEHYSWTKVTTCVHSLMSKEPYPDHYGWLEVRCHQTNRLCRLKLVKKGFFGGGRFEMHGAAYTPEGDHVFTLGGKWSDELWVRQAVPEDDPKKKKKSKLKDVVLPPTRTLWKQKPRPAWAEKMYRMTEHSMSINEPHADVLKWAAPTDARNRPDERAMENGDMRLCTSEKIRLEEKQRAKRKVREKAGGVWKPRWFSKRYDPETQQEAWTYMGEYWDSRAKQDWERCPDIW